MSCIAVYSIVQVRDEGMAGSEARRARDAATAAADDDDEEDDADVALTFCTDCDIRFVTFCC